MIIDRRKISAVVLIWSVTCIWIRAQKLMPFRLPDTGQTISYTTTKGEDSDYIINPPALKDNGDGTVTDYITGLMWQKADGGEMIYDNASAFCTSLTLGGYKDWRLPTNHELFTINKYDVSNPALNTNFFTKSSAEYWWTSDTRVDNSSYVWSVNAGGGTGAHLKTETVSAGGTKKIHTRAVRSIYSTTFSVDHFKDNGDGTITDNYTGLIWQKIQSTNTMTWEEALGYASTLSLAGKSDWRIPNVRELQSLNDEKLSKPSFNKTFFLNISSGNFWSSTTLLSQQPTQAWDINVDYGIVSYNPKTNKEYVLCVRGGIDKSDLGFSESQITGGEYEMGDHFGFVDPAHPSDELPIHKVKVNSFYMSKTETTNLQFISFLNSYLLKGLIEVKSGAVYPKGGTDIYLYTYQQSTPYYSINYDGTVFSIADFRLNHPVVGVMWIGAAAYCNWLSSQNGLQECYNLSTAVCDFTKNGYRLPTEAEWEYAGRSGHTNPYFNYPTGNTIDISRVNLADSKDPYEGTNTNLYPYTTPVGFYDGKLKLKSEYNWPGSVTNYQTLDGANDFGLYDMQGNVWEFVNDWYGQNYYSISPYDNPKGPDTGFIMPDGKPYRGMRGGNWYNGLVVNGINDGHSRVSNRNPSYYRGPQDPNHPYYHLGFRVARNYSGGSTRIGNIENVPADFILYQNYPNPFNPETIISYQILKASHVNLKIYDMLGKVITTLVDEYKQPGKYNSAFLILNYTLPSGVYFYQLQIDGLTSTKKMIFIK